MEGSVISARNVAMMIKKRWSNTWISNEEWNKRVDTTSTTSKNNNNNNKQKQKQSKTKTKTKTKNKKVKQPYGYDVCL